MIVMAFITSLLIYTVIMIEVEESTFSYGMLRALGVEKQTLIYIILAKSFTFAIPGILLGLFLAFLFSIPVTFLPSMVPGKSLNLKIDTLHIHNNFFDPKIQIILHFVINFFWIFCSNLS